MHTALRSFGDQLRATLVRVFAYLGALAVIAVAAPAPPGMAVGRPYRAFALNSLPEPDYAIHRHPGGGRKDILTVGAEDGAASEPRVQQLFANAEQRRSFCAPTRSMIPKSGNRFLEKIVLEQEAGTG